MHVNLTIVPVVGELVKYGSAQGERNVEGGSLRDDLDGCLVDHGADLADVAVFAGRTVRPLDLILASRVVVDGAPVPPGLEAVVDGGAGHVNLGVALGVLADLCEEVGRMCDNVQDRAEVMGGLVVVPPTNCILLGGGIVAADPAAVPAVAVLEQAVNAGAGAKEGLPRLEDPSAVGDVGLPRSGHSSGRLREGGRDQGGEACHQDWRQ